MPRYWSARQREQQLRVGDVEHDEAFNRRISPLFHAERVRAPLLIAHGANDPRVPLRQAEEMVAALRAHGSIVEFIVYPDEGHGIMRPENRLDWGGRVEAFLARHLGGRCEPWQPVPGASAQVR